MENLVFSAICIESILLISDAIKLVGIKNKLHNLNERIAFVALKMETLVWFHQKPKNVVCTV